jgi:predicted lipase
MAGSNSKIINENTEVSQLKSLLSEYKKNIDEQKLQINGLLSEQKRLHNQIDKLIDKIK